MDLGERAGLEWGFLVLYNFPTNFVGHSIGMLVLDKFPQVPRKLGEEDIDLPKNLRHPPHR